jgi:hypothetical protein
MAEFRKRFFQIVGQHRPFQKVRGCPLVVCASGFGAKFVPIFDISITAAEPGEGNKIDLFVVVLVMDEAH